LKGNPRLLWNDAHRSQGANGGDYLVEKRSNLWPLPAKMMLEIMSPAGVRLVAIRKTAPALLTLP
jgi:hypothetical protein